MTDGVRSTVSLSQSSSATIQSNNLTYQTVSNNVCSVRELPTDIAKIHAFEQTALFLDLSDILPPESLACSYDIDESWSLLSNQQTGSLQQHVHTFEEEHLDNSALRGGFYLTNQMHTTEAGIPLGKLLVTLITLFIEACSNSEEAADAQQNDPDSTPSPCPQGGSLQPYRQDADGDGFGRNDDGGASSVWACSPPEGYVTNGKDCDDTDPTISPNAKEICDDGINNNCAQGIDEEPCIGGPCDLDIDEVEGPQCGGPDCNDSDAGVKPGTVEKLCNNQDDNCDGQIDEGRIDYNAAFCLDASTLVWYDSCSEPHETINCPSPSTCDDTKNECVFPMGPDTCDLNNDGFIDDGRIPDIDLHNGLTQALNLAHDDDIPLKSAQELTGLVSLEARYISDIRGIECFSSVTGLHLSWNFIADITPLGAMPQLERVFLSDNNITDIGPLGGLANLEVVRASHNKLVEVGSFGQGGLRDNLRILDLSDNHIEDFNVLWSSMRHVKELYLQNNQIEHAFYGPWGLLKELNTLNLRNNQLDSIAGLLKEEGLGVGDRVYLNNNPKIPESQILELCDRGVTVFYGEDSSCNY